jgi:hypothetical protein
MTAAMLSALSRVDAHSGEEMLLLGMQAWLGQSRR